MTQQKKKKPRYYKVAVYFRTDEGVWHGHGIWTGEAVSAIDAKIGAIDALSDDRVESWKAEIIARGGSELLESE